MRTSTRNSRIDAASIKSCAAHHGVSERAVRQWRLTDDTRWRAWLARSARAGEQLEVFSGVGEVPSDPSTEAEAARIRFALLSKLVDQATARGEVAGLPVLLKSAQECQRLLAGCREAEAEWLTRQRKLIPRAEVQEMRQTMIEPLIQVVKAMPGEIARECNPDDPHRAEAALHWWLEHRFEGHYHAAVAAAKEILETQPQTAE